MSLTSRIEPYKGKPGPLVGLAQTGSERACTVNSWQEFVPEVTLPYLRLRRLKVLATAARSFPASKELYFGGNAPAKWVVYFCYAPNGAPTVSHRFTVERLQSEGYGVLVVCAAPTPEHTKSFLDLTPDALIWKELRGFDFSGFSVGLSALVRRFDKIDVLVMNDSVVGPFHSLRPLLDSSPWDLTGFVTSYTIENHMISCAFYFRGFDRRMWDACRTVLFRGISFNRQGPVVFLQETRLGSVLARSHTVGSILSPSADHRNNQYLLGNPKGLLDVGFPFLKRSIFTKFASEFDADFYRDCLVSYGHPEITASA
ncbi:hypothetical protein EI545_17740 [Tabrizicola piscis]|uniref:Uncharacterized protein n=1 Tax=Tabrizicola piscis TaxID=2494374 RepID=A0A3S8UA67_9RHOB|nr:hypothetical protein [Tabrizicola piscis]AZL60504.1 hypothetical protein EI545_17740 [Tabrizicola piscis]